MNKLKVSYLGPEGTFSNLAAQAIYPHAEYLPCENLSKVAKNLVNQESDIAILPIENSTSSSVHEAVDLVINHKLQIVAETFLPISFDLICKKSTEFNQIKKISVHPQAAQQCSNFLNSAEYEVILTSSNIQSQKLLLEEDDDSLAAISLADLCSDELKIIKKGVNNHSENVTRFVAVSLDSDLANKSFKKITTLIKINHEPGSLAKVLQEMANLDINLTKIESRPIPCTNWEYLFWIDFLADQNKLAKFLEAAKRFTNSIEIIGKY